MRSDCELQKRHQGSEGTDGVNVEEERLKIEGKNAVSEAVRGDRTFEKILIEKESKDRALSSLAREAIEKGITVRFEPKARLDALSETKNHQGVIAFLSAFRYYEPEDLLKEAADRGEKPFLILLDGIEDPHNFGAILRTAHLSGAHGVIIPKNRAAGLNATAAKTSAGAFEYVKVARVANLVRTMEDLKKQGLWLIGADMGGETMYRVDFAGPVGLVIGNEGKGLSRLVKEHLDLTTSIPMKGKIDSLNASVAAGILMYEVVRQRSFSGK